MSEGWTLPDLIELIGADATIKLMERWGGIRLYVPATIDVSHIIARTIGIEAARILSASFPAEDIPVPRGAQRLRNIRNHEIKRRFKTESAATIARDLGMTERWVYEIVGRDMIEDDKQGALF